MRSVASAANFAKHHDVCRVWDPGGWVEALMGRQAAVDGWMEKFIELFILNRKEGSDSEIRE